MTPFEKLLWAERNHPWYQRYAKKKNWHHDDNQLWRTASDKLVTPPSTTSVIKSWKHVTTQYSQDISVTRAHCTSWSVYSTGRRCPTTSKILPILHNMRRGQVLQSELDTELASLTQCPKANGRT
jgi:hypothetical protein